MTHVCIIGEDELELAVHRMDGSYVPGQLLQKLTLGRGQLGNVRTIQNLQGFCVPSFSFVARDTPLDRATYP